MKGVALGSIIREFQLEVLRGAEGYADRLVTTEEMIRPGLPLKGFFEHFNPERLQVIGGGTEAPKEPLEQIGAFSFGGLNFEVWEGAGGHLPGEIMLVERSIRLAFTGDILINPRGSTREQRTYNSYAPYLMTSVDTNPPLAAAERRALAQVLGPGKWNVFGGHGMNQELSF